MLNNGRPYLINACFVACQYIPIILSATGSQRNEVPSAISVRTTPYSLFPASVNLSVVNLITLPTALQGMDKLIEQVWITSASISQAISYWSIVPSTSVLRVAVSSAFLPIRIETAPHSTGLSRE